MNFLTWKFCEFLVPPREIIDIELEVINVKALDEKYKLEPEITPEEIDQTEYDEFIGIGKYFMTKGKKQVPDKLSLPKELRLVLTVIRYESYRMIHTILTKIALFKTKQAIKYDLRHQKTKEFEKILPLKFEYFQMLILILKRVDFWLQFKQKKWLVSISMKKVCFSNIIQGP